MPGWLFEISAINSRTSTLFSIKIVIMIGWLVVLVVDSSLFFTLASFLDVDVFPSFL